MSDDRESKFKILIVDDVPKNIQVVANILQGQGYAMAFAQNGSAAIDLARTNPFDLILLDIMMPEIDGFEVCRRLSRMPETRDIPVLFLTAKTDTESLVKGFGSGAVDYVTKPINDAELLARVKTHLELFRIRKKLMESNQRLSEEIVNRKKAETLYRNMFENAVQGMFQSTLTGKLLSLNPAFAKILGCEDAPSVLCIPEGILPFYERPQDHQRILDALRNKGTLVNYGLKIRKKDGEMAWINLNLRLTRNDDQEPVIEGIAIDDTARKLVEEELRKSREKFRLQAVHDNLTGLFNTRYLYQGLKNLVDACTSKNRPFSLIFMDVDDFKKVVDTHGHLKGSQTLQELAKTIQSCLTEPSYGVAYGGDEFVVVLPGFDKSAALAKAHEIRQNIRETHYLSNKGLDVRISASFGIATFPDDASDVSGLLSLADQAMFRVKGEGKDAVRTIA